MIFANFFTIVVVAPFKILFLSKINSNYLEEEEVLLFCVLMFHILVDTEVLLIYSIFVDGARRVWMDSAQRQGGADGRLYHRVYVFQRINIKNLQCARNREKYYASDSFRLPR